jgi:hypothetical protein
MIAAGDHEFHIRQLGADQTKRIDHEFKPFVSSPFAKSEYAVRIPAAREIRIFGASSENAVSAYVNIVSAIFIEENLAISRHQHRHRVGQQQHTRGHGASQSISTREADAEVLEIDRIHQMMEGDVRVLAAYAREERNH